MKLLIILFCIVILFYNHKKEGFFKSAVSAFNEGKQKLEEEAKRIAEAAERLRKQVAKCNKRSLEHNQVVRERAMWGKKIKNIKTFSTYYDRNFNKRVYDHHKNDMNILNNTINKNTRLNNDLNNILTRIKIIQTNNKDLVDQLKTQNTYLKECKMNKELTDNDYDVLK